MGSSLIPEAPEIFNSVKNVIKCAMCMYIVHVGPENVYCTF